MNIYEIDAGERRMVGSDRYDNTVIYLWPTRCRVIEESRGRAKSRYIRWWNNQDLLEESMNWKDKLSIHLYSKNTTESEGVAVLP